MRTWRDYLPSPQPGVAINLLLQLGMGSPQRRTAVNMFPQPSVAVDFARRGDWVSKPLYT